MLWYKAWLETRWRFVIGLALLMCAAAAAVVAYPRVIGLLPMAAAADTGGELGRRIREAAEIESSYRGYIWYQWFNQNHAHLATIFAVLLGSGGLLSSSSGGAALFTLSLPISRGRLVGVRAAAGLAEVFLLALAPALLLPLLSPGVGEQYAIGEALIHAACVFVACSVFFSLAFLLSTVFSDIWRPLLIAFALALVLAGIEEVFRAVSGAGIFGVMSGEEYFRTGRIPWLGLLVSAAASAAMLYVSFVNVNQRDF